MQKNLSPEEHYKSLPKKRSGSSVLFLNEKGELLIVKPSYKSGWLPVGGTVDDSESPSVAAQRETREEIGLDLILSDLASCFGFEIKNILILPQGKGNSSQQMGQHGREVLRKCVYVWRKG